MSDQDCNCEQAQRLRAERDALAESLELAHGELHAARAAELRGHIRGAWWALEWLAARGIIVQGASAGVIVTWGRDRDAVEPAEPTRRPR